MEKYMILRLVLLVKKSEPHLKVSLTPWIKSKQHMNALAYITVNCEHQRIIVLWLQKKLCCNHWILSAYDLVFLCLCNCFTLFHYFIVKQGLKIYPFFFGCEGGKMVEMTLDLIFTICSMWTDSNTSTDSVNMP